MTIQYCDRCGVELKAGEQSGVVSGVDDADDDGGGNITHSAELCVLCYLEFVEWLEPKKPSA